MSIPCPRSRFHISGWIMVDPSDFDDQDGYPGKCTNRHDPSRHREPRPKIEQISPVVAIEFVVVEGPEGERLQELQVQAVRRVLTRLLEKRGDATESED